MSATKKEDLLLLRWIAPSQGLDTQDPLGMDLRVSARLAAQLLHCITSITPRARYYSFLAWCLTDYVRNQRKTGSDRGLEDALAVREKAYALACIASHDGETCEGKRIVGTEKAVEAIGSKAESFKLRDLFLFQSGPSGDYLGSLINLGLFAETRSQEFDVDEDIADEKAIRPTWDDVEITPICESLGDAFGTCIEDLAVVDSMRSTEPTVSRNGLITLGTAACPCRLSVGTASDRKALLDLFFARSGSGHMTHLLRRRTLLLLLACIEQIGAMDVPFNRFTFSDLIVYGAVERNEDVVEVVLPPALTDIAEKWLMFHLHGFASAALEGAFAWLVWEADQAGTSGLPLGEIETAIDEEGILAELLGEPSRKSVRFGELTPRQTYGLLNADIDRVSENIGLLSRLSERRLAGRLTGYEEVGTLGGGLATSGILLAVTLARLRPLASNENGTWLAAESRNPHLDLSPPILERCLQREHGEWMDKPWAAWMPGLLHRFVIRQHEMMGYEKAKDNRSIILSLVDGHLFATGEYPRATIGNPRLGSALRILEDLALIGRRGDDVLELTSEGERWLAQELEDE